MSDRTSSSKRRLYSGDQSKRDGWMNYRTATRMQIDDEPTCYLLHTRIYGLIPDSVKINLKVPHLIIEGQLEQHDGKYHLGRYVRQVLIQDAIDTRYISSEMTPAGELLVSIPKVPLQSS